MLLWEVWVVEHNYHDTMIVVFDYPHFPKFLHTNGDDTIPRQLCFILNEIL